MMTSLSKFAKETGLPKSSVYVRCQELNFDVSNGLTPAMVEQLEHEFNVSLPRPKQQEEAPLSPTQVQVEVGNHQITLASPELPQAFTLEGLRQSEALVLEDPLAIAHQFLQVADQLQSAMQTDIQQRQQRLEQTKQAQTAIATKRQQLELEARLYQLQTQTLDQAQTAEVQSLQDSLAALQRMGKQSSVE